MCKEENIIQRKKEWLELSKTGMAYHKKQFQEPYRSTIAFCDWLESNGLFTSNSKLNIVDIGAGAGSNVYYMSGRYPHINFTGIELNKDLVNFGNELFRENKIQNCSLKYGDLYNLDEKNNSRYDGVVSFQTLSWLPEYKTPIKRITKLNPEWIAITSLFFDGEVDIKIEIKDFSRPGKEKPYKEGFYNIYPIPHVKDYFNKLGYSNFEYIMFDIDIDLPKPRTKGMTTYTEKMRNGKRIQISGGVLMSWYFIIAKK